jgi:hypothetical protein
MNANKLNDKIIFLLEEKIQLLQEQKELLYEIIETQKSLISRNN